MGVGVGLKNKKTFLIRKIFQIRFNLIMNICCLKENIQGYSLFEFVAATVAEKFVSHITSCQQNYQYNNIFQEKLEKGLTCLMS